MPEAVVPTTSKRRATPGKLSRAAVISPGASPSSRPIIAAAAAFSRLCRPGCGTSRLSRSPAQVRVPRARSGPTLSTFSGASASPARPYVKAATSSPSAAASGQRALTRMRAQWHQLDAERARRAHLRRVGLDGARVDEAVDGRGDRAAVLGHDVDAEVPEARGDFRALALVEGPVGALDSVAADAHELGEGAHAAAGDAREVVPASVGRGQEHAALCSRNARFALGRGHGFPRVYGRGRTSAKAFLTRRRLTLSIE